MLKLSTILKFMKSFITKTNNQCKTNDVECTYVIWLFLNIQNCKFTCELHRLASEEFVYARLDAIPTMWVKVTEWTTER